MRGRMRSRATLPARLVLLAMLLFAGAAQFAGAQNTEKFAGVYKGKWASKAYDGRHKGNATLKIRTGRNSATRMVFVSKYAGKRFRVVLKSLANGKTKIKVANAKLRRDNSGVVKGKGRIKFRGSNKALVRGEAPLFFGTGTVDMKVQPTSDGIKASGYVGFETPTDSIVLFTFAFVGVER